MISVLAALLACSCERQGTTSQSDAASPPPEDAGEPDAGHGPRPGRLHPDAALEENVVLPDKCLFGCDPAQHLLNFPVTTADEPPPAISGGTLLVTRDAKWLVAADPDRDKLYFIDVEKEKLSHVRTLPAGSEPGRVIEDGAGRIHVALRRRGALASLGHEPDSPLTERALCAQPRGLAYDAAHESIHVACADGKLVTLAAAADGVITRTLELGRDLRDVLVRGDELLVTRFRASELLRVGKEGDIVSRALPPTALVQQSFDEFTGQQRPPAVHTPNVAWRAIDIAGKGSVLLHQRSRTGEIATTSGGYGSGDCSGIVQVALTIGLDGARTVSADLSEAAVAVDLAANPSGTMVAVASPGNFGTGGEQVMLYSLTGLSPLNPHVPAEARKSLWRDGVRYRDESATEPACLNAQTRYPIPNGQVSSVAFVTDSLLALFEREPAAISFVHLPTRRPKARIELSQPARYDTGHAVFHLTTRAGVACASCHAEAGDDAHVWLFEGIGERRTQSLRGGILGTEPFHWDGDMKDFDMLAHEVFGVRMSGNANVLTSEQSTALGRWIDEQPLWAATTHDPERAQRGKALFEAPTAGCAGCHAGTLLTDNQSVDVGTGAAFQVPALRGVSYRLPLMHNGCAKTLRQRFDVACGGDHHGDTSMLSAAQLDDLIAYLETL